MNYPHVLIFMRDFTQGGAQVAMINLAEGMLNAGVRVKLVVFENKGELADTVPSTIEVVSLNSGNIISAIRSFSSYLKGAGSGVIISALLKPNFVAVCVARISGWRLMVTEHPHLESYVASKSGIAKIICKAALKITHTLSDEVISVSDAAARSVERVSGLPQGKVHAIYNPIFKPEMLNSAFEKVTHKWLDEKTLPVIVSVGRLVRLKGFDTLLNAFAQVRQDINAKLIIAGDGPEKNNLQMLARKLGIENDVDFPGFVKNPVSYIAKSDLYVLSSRHESFGNTLVEALAAGVPIVSTDCPVGPRELLDNGRYGDIVPVDNVQELANAMKKVLTSGVTQESITIRKKRAEDFSVTQAVQKYLGIVVQYAAE